MRPSLPALLAAASLAAASGCFDAPEPDPPRAVLFAADNRTWWDLGYSLRLADDRDNERFFFEGNVPANDTRTDRATLRVDAPRFTFTFWVEGHAERSQPWEPDACPSEDPVRVDLILKARERFHTATEADLEVRC